MLGGTYRLTFFDIFLSNYFFSKNAFITKIDARCLLNTSPRAIFQDLSNLHSFRTFYPVFTWYNVINFLSHFFGSHDVANSEFIELYRPK